MRWCHLICFLDSSRAGRDREEKAGGESRDLVFSLMTIRDSRSGEREDGGEGRRKSDFSVKKWQGEREAGREAGREGRKGGCPHTPPMESLSILRNMEQENPDSGQQRK
jgi:hypothetical protein